MFKEKPMFMFVWFDVKRVINEFQFGMKQPIVNRQIVKGKA